MCQSVSGVDSRYGALTGDINKALLMSIGDCAVANVKAMEAKIVERTVGMLTLD